MTTNFRVLLVVVASLFLSSCGWNSSDFSEGKAKAMLEAQPVSLESEQVSLTQQQVDCGVGAELWDSPNQVSKDRVVSRLNSDARALNFSDDIAVADAGYRQPYVQVRGAFMLKVDDVSGIRDSNQQGIKIVDVHAGIKVSHPCLTAPLPLMGVKRGSFTPDVPASFAFSLQNNGWHVDGMVH